MTESYPWFTAFENDGKYGTHFFTSEISSLFRIEIKLATCRFGIPMFFFSVRSSWGGSFHKWDMVELKLRGIHSEYVEFCKLSITEYWLTTSQGERWLMTHWMPSSNSELWPTQLNLEMFIPHTYMDINNCHMVFQIRVLLFIECFYDVVCLVPISVPTLLNWSNTALTDARISGSAPVGPYIASSIWSMFRIKSFFVASLPVRKT